MPPSPLPDFCTLLDETVDGAEPSAERKDGLLSFKPLPKQSPRVALILDRFSIHCPIQYCSNDLFVETTTVMGRSFYDFVLPKNEHQVREWIDVIKAWGVNERGQPSNGGFGYGKFTLLPKGRDSRYEVVTLCWCCPLMVRPIRGERINDGADGKTTTNRRRDILASSRGHSARPHPQSGGHNRPRPQVHVYTKETVVDAIFSAHSDGILVILRPTTLPSP